MPTFAVFMSRSTVKIWSNVTLSLSCHKCGHFGPRQCISLRTLKLEKRKKRRETYCSAGVVSRAARADENQKCQPCTCTNITYFFFLNSADSFAKVKLSVKCKLCVLPFIQGSWSWLKCTRSKDVTFCRRFLFSWRCCKMPIKLSGLLPTWSGFTHTKNALKEIARWILHSAFILLSRSYKLHSI